MGGVTFVLDTYRRLHDPINDEGPWALTGNPNKPFHNGRQGQKILVIGVHITAGLDDWVGRDDSAESTVAWGRTTTGASWHVCIDSDSIIPCLPDWYVAWVQGVKGYSFNKPGLGIEIGARSTDWTSKPAAWVEKTLRNVAAWVAPRVIRYGIPVRHETSRDAAARLIAAGKPVGFMSHWTIDPKNRSDPGLYKGKDTFPWALFLRLVNEEVARRKGQPVTTTPTLRRGSTDSVAIRKMQTRLNTWGFQIDVDGSFGPATEAAVRRFQTSKGLDPDGVVGPKTWAELNKAPGKPPVKEIEDMTPNELRTIVREELEAWFADPLSARLLFARHRIMLDPHDPTGERVTPSHVIEAAAGLTHDGKKA